MDDAPPGLIPRQTGDGTGVETYALPPNGHTRRASVSTEVAMKSNDQPLLLLVLLFLMEWNSINSHPE